MMLFISMVLEVVGPDSGTGRYAPKRPGGPTRTRGWAVTGPTPSSADRARPSGSSRLSLTARSSPIEAFRWALRLMPKVKPSSPVIGLAAGITLPAAPLSRVGSRRSGLAATSGWCALVDFRVLGPVEVVAESGDAERPSGRQGTLLSCLLIAGSEIVSHDRLIDALWGEQPPPTA